MRAIARKTARSTARSIALVSIAMAFAYADAHDDVIEAITSMADALSQVSGENGNQVRGNLSQFMAAFSKDMPEYDTLRNNVAALMNEGEISSSVQPLDENGEGQTYQIDLDWLLQVRSLEKDGPLVRRREVVHCEFRKEKKHWKIIALKPLDFFTTAKLGQ
jgi:hypothetical protein